MLPPQEVESIIASSGFDVPVLFFQTTLIHAWYELMFSNPVGLAEKELENDLHEGHN